MEQPPHDPSPEELKTEIKELINALYLTYHHLYDTLGPELQEDWYAAEIGGQTAEREGLIEARDRLKTFHATLDRLVNKG